MARARNIKPGFFVNEDLLDLDPWTRLLFIGLWTLADKAGRLEDRPKKIKIGVFPVDNVDVTVMLSELNRLGFIKRYEVDGSKYIQVVNWDKHQNPHHTEKESVIPNENGVLTVKKQLKPSETPKDNRGNPADSLIPDSGFTDSLIPEDSADKSAKSRGTVLRTYLDECKAAGVKPIPDDHYSRSFAGDAGIASDMLAMCWFSFVEDHTSGGRKAKKYKDWAQAFGNAVKANWYKFWFVDNDGLVQWTSQGKLYKTAHDAKQAKVKND